MQFRKIGSTDNADMYFSRIDNNYLLAFLLLGILAFYSASATFSFGKLFYLTTIMYFALLLKRQTGGSYWLRVFVVSGLVSIMIVSWCTESPTSFAAAGLTGLLGALDVLRRRVNRINKGPCTSIWAAGNDVAIFALGVFVALVIFNIGDSGTELSLLLGTLAGYGLGYLAPLAGRTRLHYSNGCVLHVVSHDFAVTGGEQTGTLRIDHFEEDKDVLLAEVVLYNRKNEKVIAFEILHGQASGDLAALASSKQLNKLDLQG